MEKVYILNPESNTDVMDLNKLLESGYNVKHCIAQHVSGSTNVSTTYASKDSKIELKGNIVFVLHK